MDQKMIIIGAVLLVLITAGLTYYIAKSGVSQNGTKPTITVTGEATKTVSPDQLTLGISVEGNGSTVSASQADAASKIARLKSALVANGVNESDIQTVSYYTNPEYNGSCYNCYPRPVYYGTSPPTDSATGGAPPSGSGASAPNIAYPAPVPPYPYCDDSKCTPIGYKTVHTITVNSGNVNGGGALLDAALAVDGAKFDYVYFTLKESTRIAMDDELQGEAAAAAKSKAQKIASGVGASLGKVVSINPSFQPYPIYAKGGVAMPENANASPPTELFPTQTTISGSITVVYEIDQ